MTTDEIVMLDPSVGPMTWIPGKEKYYTIEDLNSIRKCKGTTEAIKQIFLNVDDQTAKMLSEDKNATVSWFDESIPEASDITNLMMSEFVCSKAIYNWQQEIKDYYSNHQTLEQFH